MEHPHVSLIFIKWHTLVKPAPWLDKNQKLGFLFSLELWKFGKIVKMLIVLPGAVHGGVVQILIDQN